MKPLKANINRENITNHYGIDQTSYIESLLSEEMARAIDIEIIKELKKISKKENLTNNVNKVLKNKI